MTPTKNKTMRGRDRNLFKSSVMKKMSGLLATLMIVSILTPLLAFASAFEDITYRSNGDVTGYVYFDGELGEALKGRDSVTLTVYNKDGKFFNVDAKYGFVFEDGGATKYYFSFEHTITESTYDPIQYKFDLNGQSVVSEWVYKDGSGSTPGWGGGGGGYYPGSIVDFNGKADAYRLAELLKGNKNASLEIDKDFVLLPASALIEGESLTIYNKNTSFTLPIKALKLEDLAKELGVELKDLWIRVEMKEVKDDALKAIEDSVKALNAKLIATPYDFKVTAEAGDKTKAITSFGNTYTNSSINFEGSADASKSTGVVSKSNKLAFAPSVFSKDGDNSKVTIKRNGTGVYAAIATDISFNDVASHWAKSYVDLLSHKLIVDGYEDGSFGPERNITRAEFAAIVTRSLGLDTSVTSSTYFSDVQSGDWYAGVVNAAVQSGIVDGYEDGTFRPNAQINREELAAMVVRALAYAGKDVQVSSTEQASLLAKFADADSIVWGQAELAAAVKAGIVDGMTDTTIAPRNDATRAQAAAMLNRLLNNAGFIN